MASFNITVKIRGRGMDARGMDVLAAGAWIAELAVAVWRLHFAVTGNWMDAEMQLRAFAMVLTFVAWQNRRLKTAKEAYELRDREFEESRAEVVELRSRLGRPR